MINGINTTSDISKLLYVSSRAVRRVKFETIIISRVVFIPNITYKSCYYLFILLPTKLSQSNCINFSCSSITSKTKSNFKNSLFVLPMPNSKCGFLFFFFFFYFESLLKRINKSLLLNPQLGSVRTLSHNVIMKCNVCFRQLVMGYLVSVQTRAVYPDMFSLQPQEQGKNLSLHFVKGLRRNINAEN